MLFSLLGLLGILVFAPRCALSVFQFVAYSRVSQCGPFNVSFWGGQPPVALPLTLTVIPFNSTPLAFVVPNSAWDSSTNSGSYATFLPLPAGVAFLASLDDAAGHSAALISDVAQVLPSANTSCISSDTAAPAPFQLVNSEVSQCLPFSVTVSRNTSSQDHRLSTRAFIPTSLSFELQWTSFRTSQGVDTFTFILNAAEGLHIVLLFDDGQGNRQASDLLSVGSGPSKCLETSSAALAGSEGISRPAVIALSVTSSIAVLIIILLGVIFIRRERRKLVERLATLQTGRTTPPSPLLSPPAPVPSKPTRTRTSGGVPSSPVPVDPVYPPESFVISSTKARARQSTRSTILAPVTPTSLRSTKSRTSRISTGRSVSIKTKSSFRGTNSRRLADLDIAGLLELASQLPAATEAPRGYPGASPHTVTPVPTPSVPPSPSESNHSASNRSLARELSHQEPDFPLSPQGRLSQEWFALEEPPVPAASVTVVAPRNGRPSSVRPLSTSFSSAGMVTMGKKIV